MTIVSGHIGKHPSLTTVQAGSSASVENQMPDPAQFSDGRGKSFRPNYRQLHWRGSIKIFARIIMASVSVQCALAFH